MAFTQPYSITISGTGQGGCTSSAWGTNNGACSTCPNTSCTKTFSCSSAGQCDGNDIEVTVTACVPTLLARIFLMAPALTS